jgi:hypothetical protein
MSAQAAMHQHQQQQQQQVTGLTAGKAVTLLHCCCATPSTAGYQLAQILLNLLVT